MASFGSAELFDIFNDEEHQNDDKHVPDEQNHVSQVLPSNLKREHAKENDPESQPKKPREDSISHPTDFQDSALFTFDKQIDRHKFESVEGCLHEIAVPRELGVVPLKPCVGKPVKEYSFVLDPFQRQAILCLENGQSVLVSAHTSAGKTVVAEYAVALSLKNKQRVIYTTPIKALSNQKYREFYEEFKDVGLITGDVTISPNASCLIMTTEILRSMLYRGSEVMREVGWVIFDEIHYMRDKDRGYVWEETIVLLPDNVHYVFLSATIPNAQQFAEWICHLHNQPCHVVYTDNRPVPLQHYVFPVGGSGLHLVVDADGNFKEELFNKAMSSLEEPSDPDYRRVKRTNIVENAGSCYRIIKMIMERNLAPVIVFSFSRKECEAYAVQAAKMDLNSEREKKLVDEVFQNAMNVLTEEDRQLPQVDNVLPLLRRGIGIHHGGLLPILKETVEILFSEGLIKALFATETFAMGLNMPARTVLFTAARKYDGVENRWLNSGEYIQMSGRAGRRGLDEKGIVILMVDERMPAAISKSLLYGKADKLVSSFHLTYNMVLNLLRVEEINPEYMLERSFFQFQNYTAIPDLCNKVKTLTQAHESIIVPREEDVRTYHSLRLTLDGLSKAYQEYVTKPEYLVPFLQPGRLVTMDKKFGWCVLLDREVKSELTGTTVTLTVLIRAAPVEAKTEGRLKLDDLKAPAAGQERQGYIIVLPGASLMAVSVVRVNVPSKVYSQQEKNQVVTALEQVEKHFSGQVPLLDPIVHMKIKDKKFEDLVKNIRIFEERLYQHPIQKDPAMTDIYSKFLQKDAIGKELIKAKVELREARSLLHLDELKNRKRVLRRLGYCTDADVIQLKGRVACELSSSDELLLTEMMFEGAFNELDAAKAVALLSCMVCDETAKEYPKLSEELTAPLRKMQDLAKKIVRVTVECKIPMDEEEYVKKFKPYLMDVVYAWCKGANFSKVCAMTDIFEGSIIRSMKRLEELLRQMCQAAKAIGSAELEQKFLEGGKMLKKDIAFAASLYL
ncbi:unnamed protein product [Darwinula stevensoni]|uniref:RNA helicase n=1 Tax=Darwinula stevensoni TaxID=69355 RepID=A0A7R8ZZK5_9CRUS|nr:unnamed protein product [Darwinula stevensoni]CAG0883855.1 unnamed protein product [Darwinula stevensoni]